MIVPIVVTLILLVLPIPAPAQTGTLNGSVRTSTGTVAEGARVTVLHRRSQQATTVVTDAVGQFSFPPLAIGLYDLRVHKPGYADLEEQGLALKDGVRALELTLESDDGRPTPYP